ncbi:MAG: site-2 protease family protein [Anaerolineaceae bacterium]|nr:site-2 protease family protein [Anaerolineaceae bacterium]MCB9101194.1 site-2 protease family protein [Anaerolineales bacterium]
MGWSFKIGKLFGIDLKVHFTFLLILIWGAFNYGGSAGPLYGILVTLALFTLVVLHELGHSLAAMWYGIPVKDITLLPIGGVARLERMPEKPVQELVVAIAGPAVNVVLAALLLPVVLALGFSGVGMYGLTLMMEPGLLGLSTFLLFANVSLVIFNMIPAFPLDGGRVLRAALGLFTTYQKATQIAVSIGRALAILLGIFAIYNHEIFLAFIAFFIFMAGSQEGQAVAARSLLRKVSARQALRENRVALSPYATVGQVASMMLSNSQSNFAVLDPVDGQFLGVATSGSISQAMQAGQWHRRITEIMHQAKHIPTIALNATLDEVQDKLTEASTQFVAVYDGLHFKGVITANDVYRVFRFLSQSGYSSQSFAA